MLSHSSPAKANTKEFVDYYLANDDINYVNDVKNLSIATKIGNVKKQPLKIPTNKAASTEEIKPKTKEEVKAITDYLSTLNN